MTLEVLICTFGAEGIKRVSQMSLPEISNVHYIVSWQKSEGSPVPESLTSRHDVRIIPCDGLGISRNRNNSLAHWTADIALLADDDLNYTPEGLKGVIKTFENNPTVDIATFRHTGADSKRYPARSCSLVPMPKGYYYTSVEIAIRRTPATQRLKFNTDFGLGSGLFLSGEEDVFMLEAEKSGLDIRFFPLDIVAHDNLSTGLRKATARGEIAAWGAVIRLRYPWSWPFRVPLKALREWRAGHVSMMKALYFSLWGSVRVRRSFDASVLHP